MSRSATVAIVGAGSIGRAMALGLAASGRFRPGQIAVTRRTAGGLHDLGAQGFLVLADNRDAVRRSDVIIVAVQPRQLDAVIREIAAELDGGRHVLISVVSGATIADITAHVGAGVAVVRAMPNTAIAVGRSMTCLAAAPEHAAALETAAEIFRTVGATMVIAEEHMIPATALCACGVAFFLRAVRAASQGGIEIGFHPEQALAMAAQTALGAAALVLDRSSHPESEIDAVTTPRGCTITGLNEMEHQGFSSALIKGIVTSAAKAGELYSRGGG